MINEGNAASDGVVSDALGGSNAANATAINLNVTDTAEIDEVLRHVEIVRAFTTGEPDVFAAARERRVRTESASMERLFQPKGANLLESRETRYGGFHIFAEDLACIDQKNPENDRRRF